MALREDQVSDARPTQPASPAASATPPTPGTPNPGVFESEDPLPQTTTTPAGMVVDSSTGEVVDSTVDHMTAMASAADEIAAETTASPQSSEQRAIAVARNKEVDDLINKRRLALTANLVKKDIVVRVLKHAVEVDDLKQMQIGTFPRITVDVGGIVLDKTTELGKWAEFELVSWSPITLVVAGEQNDPEANQLIKSSYDGVTLDDGSGMLVSQYVTFLRDVKKYPKASAKKYTQMLAMMISNEKQPNPIAPGDRRLFEVSLAPTSTSQWQKYLLEAGIRAGRGGADDALIRVEQVRRIVKGNTFGVITFDKAKTSTQATEAAAA